MNATLTHMNAVFPGKTRRKRNVFRAGLVSGRFGVVASLNAQLRTSPLSENDILATTFCSGRNVGEFLFGVAACISQKIFLRLRRCTRTGTWKCAGRGGRGSRTRSTHLQVRAGQGLHTRLSPNAPLPISYDGLPYLGEQPLSNSNYCTMLSIPTVR